MELIINHTYAIRETVEAFRYHEGEHARGKVVIFVRETGEMKSH